MPSIISQTAKVTPSSLVPISVSYDALDNIDQYGISTDGREPKRIFTVPTGAPILLRGTKWPEPPHSGLLHRSPPIEGSGLTRLVLVLVKEEELASLAREDDGEGEDCPLHLLRLDICFPP